MAAVAQVKLESPMKYFGACDASAAAAVAANLFVAASDEDNSLRVYRLGEPAPLRVVDLNAFLGVDAKAREADIEGAARCGELVFWIGSHGRNKDGKVRTERQLLFATQFAENKGNISVAPVGRPYKSLLADFSRDPRLAEYRLDAAAALAPKIKGALNIEGLCATPEGHLLIGFRNPIPGGRSLLIPLLNPEALIKGDRAKLGPPVLLNLNGLGIRAMLQWQGSYLILAGAFDGEDKWQVFQWDGQAAPRIWASLDCPGGAPEALLMLPHQKALHILTDRGEENANGHRCKDLTDPSQRYFEAFKMPVQ